MGDSESTQWGERWCGLTAATPAPSPGAAGVGAENSCSESLCFLSLPLVYFMSACLCTQPTWPCFQSRGCLCRVGWRCTWHTQGGHPNPCPREKTMLWVRWLFSFFFSSILLTGIERGGGREKERATSIHPSTGDLAHKPGMCPHQDSNRRPVFRSWPVLSPLSHTGQGLR